MMRYQEETRRPMLSPTVLALELMFAAQEALLNGPQTRGQLAVALKKFYGEISSGTETSFTPLDIYRYFGCSDEDDFVEKGLAYLEKGKSIVKLPDERYKWHE